MAQLVERSLQTPEARGSNPVIGEILFIVNYIEKTKINKKEAGNGPFKEAIDRKGGRQFCMQFAASARLHVQSDAAGEQVSVASHLVRERPPEAGFH